MIEAIYILAALVTIILFLYPIIVFGVNYFSSPKENEFSHDVKEVYMEYPGDSGLKARWESEGYNIRWVSNKNIAKRELDGYVKMLEIDHKMKTQSILVILDSHGKVELTLMGIKSEAKPES